MIEAGSRTRVIPRPFASDMGRATGRGITPVLTETSVIIDDMSEKVILSQGEKLILLMLCEVYDQLKIKGDIDAKLIRESVASGNLWGLGWSFPEVFANGEISDTTVTETINILSMWQRLEESYAALSQEDKEWLAAKAEPFGKHVQFSGFDNNNEIDHIRAARFLIEQLGRFQNFKGRSLDAHMPTIEAHRRMLEVFTPILNQLLNLDFPAAQIAEVMEARIHPSRRADA